ncbi:MAG: Hpt domain-containing protein, partial [Deltaproteobacteria bacterium]|nr:Hpt domain-containing protein [Deltaproteobacteria bacterium]
MGNGNEQLRRRLLALFQEEAQDHLRALREGVLELEGNPGPARRAAVLETVFRGAHSLKGAARTVNLPDVVAVCQRLEDVLARLQRGSLSPAPALLDGIQGVLALLPGLLPPAGVEATHAPPEALEKSRAALAALERTVEGTAKDAAATGDRPRAEVPQPPAEIPQPRVEAPQPRAEARGSDGGAGQDVEEQPIRMRTSALQRLLGQVEELSAVRALATPRAAEARALRAALDEWERRWAGLAPGLRALLAGPAAETAGPAGGSRAELFEAV